MLTHKISLQATLKKDWKEGWSKMEVQAHSPKGEVLCILEEGG